MRKKKPHFISEAWSPVFNRLFYWYTLSLFRRRFKRVWLDNTCHPPAGNATLFIGNHNSWWDALIPVLLNERVFRMNGRTVMDERQLKKQPFFRRTGSFSINREHPRKAMKSLQHAVDLMNQSDSDRGLGLWFYPEGKLVSPETPISLESGLAWLSRRLHPSNCEIVPFAIHMHTIRSDKPEMFIKMGNAIGPSIYHSGNMLTRTTRIMQDLRKSCREESTKFDQLLHEKNGFRLLLGRKP